MDAAALLDQLNAPLALPAETEGLEFKEARESYDFGKLGRYFSALSNEAALAGREQCWLVFGVNDRRQVVGSRYRPQHPKLDSLKKAIAEMDETVRNTGGRGDHVGKCLFLMKP